MVNWGVVAIGIIIILGTFYATEIYITHEQKEQLKAAQAWCNTRVEVMGITIPIGQLAVDNLLPLFKSGTPNCEQINTLSTQLSYAWLGYVAGFLLLLVGLVIGGQNTVIREIVREPVHHTRSSGHSRSVEESEESNEEEPEEQIKPAKKANFCGKCGTKLQGHEKYCHKCGVKV